MRVHCKLNSGPFLKKRLLILSADPSPVVYLRRTIDGPADGNDWSMPSEMLFSLIADE